MHHLSDAFDVVPVLHGSGFATSSIHQVQLHEIPWHQIPRCCVEPLTSAFHIALRCQILSQCPDRFEAFDSSYQLKRSLMPCNARSTAKFIQSNWGASIKIASQIMIHIGFQKCVRNSKHLTRCFFSISLSHHFSLRIVTFCSLSPLNSRASTTFSIEQSCVSVSLAASISTHNYLHSSIVRKSPSGSSSNFKRRPRKSRFSNLDASLTQVASVCVFHRRHSSCISRSALDSSLSDSSKSRSSMQILESCGISGGTMTLCSVGVPLLRLLLPLVPLVELVRGLCHLLTLCSVPLLGLLLQHLSMLFIPI